MYTLIIFIGLLGFYFLYHTSQKMKLERNSCLPRWIAVHRKESQVIGVACLLAALIAFVYMDGLGAGFFTGLLLLMAGASIIIALPPLKLLQVRYVMGFFIVSLLLETFIFN